MGKLRIIGGARRGAHINAPDGSGTRPLRDRVRESLFNILQPDVPGAAVLDLFAGSGALGFEALSRGASSAHLFESDAAALRAIVQNQRKLRYGAEATVVPGVLPDSLSVVRGLGAPAALVFITPPYHTGLGTACLETLGAAGFGFADRALAVLEIHRDEPVPAPDGWAKSDDRTYGITRLVFYGREGTR